jgi:CRP/FNR family transcriptional regulator
MPKETKAIDYLKSIPYLRGVDASTLTAIAKAAAERQYPAGQTIIQEGDESAGLFIVQKGFLKSVKISVSGREQVVRVVGPGEVFNAIGVLASETNPGTVIALEDATVWSIERQTLLRLMDDHPTLAGAIIQSLAIRIQQLMQQVEDLSLRSVEERLARLLIEEAVEGIVLRRKWDTQAEMAARLGTVTDVLNRSLRRLADAEILEVERDQIRLLDIEQLKALAAIEN